MCHLVPTSERSDPQSNYDENIISAGAETTREEQEVPVRPKTKNSIQVRFDGSHHNKQSNNIGEKASDRVK